MAETFSLRCYCYLDRMQPQYAAFVGTITQGDLPVEGMASLYLEVAPGNEVFRLVDIAVKSTEAQPGHGWAHNLQIANDRVYNNAGTLSGGINVGQGESPEPYLNGAASDSDPGSCLT